MTRTELTPVENLKSVKYRIEYREVQIKQY